MMSLDRGTAREATHRKRRSFWSLLSSTLPALAVTICGIGPSLADGEAPQCQAKLVEQFPIEIVNGHLRVHGDINGNPASFIVDTGAQRTTIATSTVQRLHIPTNNDFGAKIETASTADFLNFAEVKQLNVGSIRHIATIVAQATQDNGVDAIIGADFLSRFDIDIDKPGNRLGFYEPTGCTPDGQPVATVKDAIDIVFNYRAVPYFTMFINGKPLRAMIDTGSFTSLMDETGAELSGAANAPVEGTPSTYLLGPGGRRLPIIGRHLDEVAVGPLKFTDAAISVSPVFLPNAHVALGWDFFSHKRMTLFYKDMKAVVYPTASPR